MDECKRIGVAWTELGIPDGFAYPRLHFNAPSSRLLVSVADKNAPHERRRVLVRSITEPIYTPLFQCPDDITVSSMAVSTAFPVAFFSLTRWTLCHQPKGDYYGGNWHSLLRCSLDTLSVAECASDGSILFPAPFKSGWLCEILQVDDNGESIIVTASAGESHTTSRTFFVGRLNIRTRELSVITFLPGTFV